MPQDVPWIVPVAGSILIVGAWITNLLLHIRRQEKEIKRLQGIIRRNEGVDVFEE